MTDLVELIKRADSGDYIAQWEVASYIIHTLTPEEKDKDLLDRAVEYLRNAAIHGVMQGIASEELGELYFKGEYFDQDYKQAIMWFRTSTQKLNPIGYYLLGFCFYHGRGVDKNKAKAFDSFFKGTHGFINNYLMLGDMYLNGEFVARDQAYAIKLYQRVLSSEKKLHEKNNIFSDAYFQVCLRFAQCYLCGNGVKQDIDKANDCFRIAREHDNREYWLPEDRHDLLRLLDSSPYKNYKASRRGVSKKMIDTEDGDNGALLDKGVRYATGDGVKKDARKAYHYLVKHVLLNNNDSTAYKYLADIYPRLTRLERDPIFVERCRELSNKDERKS